MLPGEKSESPNKKRRAKTKSSLKKKQFVERRRPLAGQSNSISPIKRPFTVAKNYKGVVLPELNASFHIKNSIALFQELNRKENNSMQRSKKTNSSVLVRNYNNSTHGAASVNVSVNSVHNNDSFSGTKSPYVHSESPAKQHQRLLSDYSNLPAQNRLGTSKPLRLRCSSLLQITPCAPDKRSTLIPAQVTELYQAKCQDLRLQYFQSQECRFHDFCSHYCVDGKVILRELGISKNTAKVLKGIIKANKRLSHLDIHKNPVGDVGIIEIASALKYSNSLVHLDVSSNELGQKGASQLFKALVNNSSLTSLDVSSHEGLHRNHLGENGMKRLVQVLQTNKILSILNLSGNGIRNEGLAYVAEGCSKNSTLMSLKVAQNDILGNSQCLQSLKSIIIGTKLAELDLSDNPLGNSCMEALAQVLGNAGISLRRLYFCNTGLTSACTTVLFASMRSNSTLRNLRMDRNNLVGPELLGAVEELVDMYSNIESLSMSECGLGDKVGEALFRSLFNNKALKVLILQKNGLGTLTAKAAGEALEKQQCMLKLLDLSHNKIDDVGTIQIAAGLRKSERLQALNLGSNSLSNDGAKELLEAVKANSHIERVSLRFNSINSRFVSEIDQKTEANAADARRRKIPAYQKEIGSVVINEELVDELEWKAEQFKQQKEVMETELEKDFNAFEELKKAEFNRYQLIKRRYDTTVEEERGVERRLEELERMREGIEKDAEKRIRQLGQKIDGVKGRISQIEVDVQEAKRNLEAREEEQDMAKEKLKKELQSGKSKVSMLKMALDNKRRIYESLQVRSELKLGQQISDLRAGEEEGAVQSPKRPEEEQKDSTTRSRSERDRKSTEEFEVKEYNASPKLAVKKKERRKQSRDKQRPLISTKRVEEKAPAETGGAPAAEVKEEENKAIPMISVPTKSDDVESLNLIKVTGKSEKNSPKKLGPKKEPRKSGTVKKTLS